MRWKFSLIILLFLGLIILDICYGAVAISVKEITQSLLYPDLVSSPVNSIIREFRIPKAITALLAGSGLAVSGLLMQTLFRNPLAGPFVLGISNGASLGVAAFLLGGISISLPLIGQIGLIGAACLGSLSVLGVILLFSRKGLSNVSLLIIGLMIGSASGSIVSILQSLAEPERLQSFVFWSFGSVSNVAWSDIAILSIVILIGFFLTFRIQNSLSVFIVGEDYASSVGVRISRLKFMMIVITCLLAGTITAFCGPIAFVGLAVPHMARLLLRTEQFTRLFPFCIIIGACFILICDIGTQIPWISFSIPLNAISAIIGAPIVISMVIGKRKAI